MVLLSGNCRWCPWGRAPNAGRLIRCKHQRMTDWRLCWACWRDEFQRACRSVGKRQVTVRRPQGEVHGCCGSHCDNCQGWLVTPARAGSRSRELLDLVRRAYASNSARCAACAPGISRTPSPLLGSCRQAHDGIAAAVPSPRIDFERPVSPAGIGQGNQVAPSPELSMKASRERSRRTGRLVALSSARRLVNLSATAMSRPARSVRRTVLPESMCYREAALASSGRRSLALRLPNRRSRTSSPRVPPRIALALIQAEVDLDAATALRTLEPVRPGSVYAGRHSLTHAGRRHGPAQGWYSRVIGGRT